MKPDIVKDIAGRDVDCSGRVWRLNTAGSAIVLNWDKLPGLPDCVLDAARVYAKYRLPLWAPPSLRCLFSMYRLVAKCPCIATGFDGTVTMRAFEELRSRPETGGPDLARYRAWYRWSATLDLPGFDADVSGLLDAITIRKKSNRPARKKSPLEGPLTDGEREELLSKTLDASDEELPLRERVAVLLSMGLGPNSGPLSLLQVQDYSVRSSGGTSYHLLEVPRHKKRLARERAAFRLRQIDAAWAPHLERLIDRNRAAADELYVAATGGPRPEGIALPIFMRRRIRRDLQPSMREYALHMTPDEFSEMLQKASDRLDVRSRFGDELELNARRLRSTLATNLIADGKSERVVADALDHMSTGALAHYELEDYRLVASLDARLGDAIQVVADGFLGTLTEKSSEAARGLGPSSRIGFLDRERDQAEDLGNCGSNADCGLALPLACYSCREFQPWIDAPHERLLARLKDERDGRQATGKHPRIVALQDRSIQAVTEVVETIKVANACRAKPS